MNARSEGVQIDMRTRMRTTGCPSPQPAVFLATVFSCLEAFAESSCGHIASARLLSASPVLARLPPADLP